MILELLMGTMSVVGMAAGVSALVFWKKQNGNGKHEPNPWRYAPRLAEEFGETPKPPAPVQVQWPPELADLGQRITQGLDAIREAASINPPTPEWAIALRQDLAYFNDRMSEPAMAMLPPELTVGLERVTDRLEALMQMPQPEPPDLEPIVERLESLVASMPRPTTELAETLADLPHKIGEMFAAARQGKNPPVQAKPAGGGSENPPKPAPRNLPPMNPNELPATPSIPASYVPGTVTVPGGQVWSLLYLIQKQLSPNCPGSSARLSLFAETGTVYVGGASSIGGPLSATNYAYKLEAGDPPLTYNSSFPGNNTPVGEIQVFSSGGGTLHVEVQT